MPRETLTLDTLLARFAQLADLPPTDAAIVCDDPQAARYARVLEYGAVAGQPPWPRPGPRTTLALDPETGAQVVVSAQAPQGFIRIRVPQFRDALLAELSRPTDWLDSSAVREHIASSLQAAAQAAVEDLRVSAPRDSGRLARSLAVAEK